MRHLSPFTVGCFLLISGAATTGLVLGTSRSQAHPGDLRQGVTLEEVDIPADDAHLRGLLVLPQEEGGHPALVCAPNTFPDPTRPARELLLPHARACAELGLATLIYDRRGWHGSTGDGDASSFDRMASDLLAAVDWLADVPEVDPDRIGVSGFSNSGWIVSRAAAQAPRLAFAVILACAPVPPWRVDESRVETMMRGDGFDEDAVESALQYMRLRHSVARGGEQWDELQQLERALSAQAFFEYLNRSPSLHGLRRHWTTQLAYDPYPDWQRLRMPVLVVFGDHDWNYLVPDTASLARKALDDAGNRSYAIVVIPGADHLLRASTTGGRTEYLRERPFAPGVWDVVLGWIGLQVR